jgi:hypothetical protein
MHGGIIIFAYIHGREVEAERQSALPVRNERAQGEGETDLMHHNEHTDKNLLASFDAIQFYRASSITTVNVPTWEDRI